MAASTTVQSTATAMERATATAENSDQSVKLAIAMALLRSRLLPHHQHPPPASDAIHWKNKAKQRKQQVLRLTEELKHLEDGLKGDLYPQSASCKCYFFCDLENPSANLFNNRSDQRLTDVLRRRFLRQVRLQQRSKRRASKLTDGCSFAEFYRDDIGEQLELSADFLIDLCHVPCPVKQPHFANLTHQAMDFILGSLNHLLSMGKDLDLIEGTINSLIMRLAKRMCTPLGEELCDPETDTQIHIQHIIRKLGSAAYVGQRVLLSVSHMISELAKNLFTLDPFDESFSIMHDSLFMMIQLTEFLLSDYLVTWLKDEGFESGMFDEWVTSFLHARKTLQLMENRSGLYALYMDGVTGELARQIGQVSSIQKLNQDILGCLF